MKEFERKQKISDLKLTDIQRSFAEHYVEHFNISRAVRESGSTTKNVAQFGREMLSNENVMAYIEILKEYAADRVDLRLDRVLKELMRIGFSRMDHFVTWGTDKCGKSKGVVLRNPKELTEDDLAAISEIVETDTKEGKKVKIKLHSKQAALERLLTFVEGTEGLNKKKGATDQPAPSRVTINHTTVRNHLLDAKTRNAIELLSNQMFSGKGSAEVPKMTPAMRKQIEQLTNSKLIEYQPPDGAAPVDIDADDDLDNDEVS
jgi:phage terminase small subunit